MILQVDDETADLPWEMLVDRRAGGLPFICESGLVRQFRLPPSRVHAVASIAAGALVIGDPPSALPSLPGAGSEAEAVGQVLTSAGTATTTIIGSTAGGERGSLDIDITRALNSSDHRVLHIAAHGLYRRTGDTTVGGVVIGENAFVTADLLANLTTVPEIVFLNCCHLGQIGPGAEGAFDPIEHRHQASSLARVLMVAGVRALVVAGWAVDDGRAAAFAVQFWSALAAGQMFGDAVSDARRTIFEQSRDNTWAAYQCYGDPGWRLRQVTDSSDTARPVVNLRAWAARRSLELEAKAADLVDARDFRAELEQLEFHIERHWPDHGDLLAALAAAHADIGDLERAEALYARAIADPRGRAPVRAIEQGFNLLCRLALAARHQGDEDAVKSLLERLEASRSLVDGLPDNAERKALDGAHWKRMAALYGSSVGTEYLDRAIASYVASADTIRVGRRRAPPTVVRTSTASETPCSSPPWAISQTPCVRSSSSCGSTRGRPISLPARLGVTSPSASAGPTASSRRRCCRRTARWTRPSEAFQETDRSSWSPLSSIWTTTPMARCATGSSGSTAARSAGVARSEVGGARWRTCRRSASSAGSLTVSRSPRAWPTSGRPSSRRVPTHVARGRLVAAERGTSRRFRDAMVDALAERSAIMRRASLLRTTHGQEVTP